MKHIKKEQFIWDFQNKEIIPSCYENVFFNNTTYKNELSLANKEKIVYVSLVPSYINYTLVNQEDYNQKKIQHIGKDGAGILIDGNYTTDTYLQKFTSKKLRINLKRGKTRLEESFNIKYECNFGSITADKYNFLLSELRIMLEKRFKEKNIENMFLKEWDLHTTNLYSLINTKKASLFVIYSDEKPISITINNHILNSILYSKTNAFDTDYSKFGLGQIDNYILLDWCLKNNYHFLDLGFGILEYKKKWCNLFYNYEYHLYTKKGSLTASSIALMESFKIKFKNNLKIFKIDKVLQSIKFIFKKTPIEKNNSSPVETLEVKTKSDEINDDFLKNINIKNKKFKALRQPIYNYLYNSKLHVDTIETYEVTNQKNTYIVKAEEDIIKIKVLSYES
ncbi:GNAT family N-acetyltransferase [Mariniflexile jejuense]|uniref:GNAT family N-acetyltransferase n=1 Tax=Mariniflexile jejuense TaxID=1173582 RepID=A0ABW3JDU5_9FLAO